MTTRGQYAHYALKAIGAPKTLRTRRAMAAWAQAEGSLARFNPYSCTQLEGPSQPFNMNGGFPVQNYDSLEEGVDAFKRTIENPNPAYRYKPILDALRNNAPAHRILYRLFRSSWGTGALALSCLPMMLTEAGLRKYEQKPIG